MLRGSCLRGDVRWEIDGPVVPTASAVSVVEGERT